MPARWSPVRETGLPQIALKVDVDTLRGSREGVPRLLDILDRFAARASFLFSVGPDHTGWALRRVFRPGFLAKAQRTSVLAHYGLRTLLHGVVLPGPDIGRKATAEMRAAARAGHECGLHAWDHVLWQDNVRTRGEAWTRAQMRLGYERFGEIFGRAPSTHGAAGWQTNAAALHQLDDWHLAYASDGRGCAPYRIRIGSDVLGHVQLPTTLPTLDELIGTPGIDAGNVAARLLALTEAAQDQVFTLHAELEGGRLRDVLEALLAGWRAQGHRLVTLADLHRPLDPARLPIRPLAWRTVPGRSGEVVSDT